ncbi:unnamed protein product [Microthlaspi erraticum]|uniref:protein-serine/threonine phosphatase n=1 Tax=Microthlaspi erraticum TaxID=1685480 RepID=A0A6D2HD26_9BRAS|nr:unnamed protein product [Microthlaspi erraticum]
MTGREILHKMKLKAGFCGSETGRGKSKTWKNIAHGFHFVKGKANHPMEDYLVSEFKKVDGHDLGLFAIFDGHLGHDVASYLQTNLFDNILKQKDFWSDAENAIRKAYISTDAQILEQSLKLGKGGSTAVTGILIDGQKLVVANVGDSRAVMSKNGVASQLSVDHEPSMEQNDIESRGGFVSNFPGDVPRVDGQLAVARAFGDKSLKIHLSSEPDITHQAIDDETEFLVFASDGIWKVMSNQEAVDAIKSIKDPQAAAKELIEEAISKQSKDDISCIVVSQKELGLNRSEKGFWCASGNMYDVMLDEAKMWLDEPPKLETPVYSRVDDEDSDEDDEVDPVVEEKYHRQVMESGGFDVDLFCQPFGGIVPSGCSAYHVLFGKVGLHCYNIDKGTNLEFIMVKKVNAEIGSLFNFYITLEAMDPCVKNSVVTFQTRVTDAVLKYKARLRMFTTTCRIKPRAPGSGDSGEKGYRWYPDDDGDDDYYKGDLPGWLQDDALTGGDKLQFYEVKEWELRDNKWLQLYAEFALFSEWDTDLSAYLPFEMKSVVVRTKEDVASSMKLKSRNAIFYMSFTARGGPECRGIIRRTSDGRPGHMLFLEAMCWIKK